MCSIICSYDKDTFIEIAKANKSRGNLTHSVYSFDYQGNMKTMRRSEGPLDYSYVKSLPDNHYYVGHTQAPTSKHEKGSSTIHPANIENYYLWHNGIVKQRNINKGVWDTEWLTQLLYNEGFQALSNVDGSFACVLYRDPCELYVFRNDIAPLFFDENMNISSIKLSSHYFALPSNYVFKLNLIRKTKTVVAQFKTKDNPFFFG